MKRVAACLAFLAASCGEMASEDPCTAPLPSREGDRFSGVVHYVADGDTLCVGPADSDGSAWIEARLILFDAPEIDEIGGAPAQQTLSDLALNHEAECVVTRGPGGIRSWDGAHAICRINGRRIGDMMRTAGVPERRH